MHYAIYISLFNYTLIISGLHYGYFDILIDKLEQTNNIYQN